MKPQYKVVKKNSLGNSNVHHGGQCPPFLTTQQCPLRNPGLGTIVVLLMSSAFVSTALLLLLGIDLLGGRGALGGAVLLARSLAAVGSGLDARLGTVVLLAFSLENEMKHWKHTHWS